MMFFFNRRPFAEACNFCAGQHFSNFRKSRSIALLTKSDADESSPLDSPKEQVRCFPGFRAVIDRRVLCYVPCAGFLPAPACCDAGGCCDQYPAAGRRMCCGRFVHEHTCCPVDDEAGALRRQTK